MKKKSLDLLPIKVKNKNQDQSPSSKKSQIPQKRSIPPLLIKIKTKKEYRYPLKCTTLYIYEKETLFFINFYLQLFNYNRIIKIFKHLNFFLKYNKVLKTNITQFLMLNFMEIKLTINYEFF